MPTRSAEAKWEGSLQEGSGSMRLGSGAYEGAYSFGSRFGDASGTNPEELIGAAHAGCYSMALAATLGQAGHSIDNISTTADVHINKDSDGNWTITSIDLRTHAEISSEISEEEFQSAAQTTKQMCPVSRALGAVQINLEAKLG